jgi:nucleotide-binding universal stress UspA family protein
MKENSDEFLTTGHELVSSQSVPKTRWQRILVPIDFTENSRWAFELAVTLAADPEDTITVLHVVETAHPLQRGSEVMMLLKKTDSQMRREAELGLREWVAQQCDSKTNVHSAVRTGKVAEEILACAETRNCDLIVLATEPKRWIERLVTRSVVPQIQHLANCDVIGIRPAVPEAVSSKVAAGSADGNLVRPFDLSQAASAS